MLLHMVLASICQACIILNIHCKIPGKTVFIYSRPLGWHQMVGTTDFILSQDRYALYPLAIMPIGADNILDYELFLFFSFLFSVCGGCVR